MLKSPTKRVFIVLGGCSEVVVFCLREFYVVRNCWNYWLKKEQLPSYSTNAFEQFIGNLLNSIVNFPIKGGMNEYSYNASVLD